MSKHSTIIFIGALFSALAVMIGAFGAHLVEDMVTAERFDNWKTAAQYQFYHSLGIILTGFALRDRNSARLKWAGYLFAIGILLFSFSLYALALTDITMLGAITPLGGLCFISGWLLFAWEFISGNRD